MESAITSRLTRLAFIPSVPMVMPSLMATVLNSIGVAARVADPLLDPLRQLSQVEVAGHRLRPGVRHPDDRLRERLVVITDRFEV